MQVNVINPNTSATVTGTTTDGNGNFSVNIASGTYNLQFIPPSGTNLQSVLATGVTTGGAPLTIILKQSAVVHVQGSFGDSEGDAFNNSGDQITFSSPLNPGSTVHPDANGNYSVELLADQNVKVSTNIGLNGQVLEFNNLPVGALQSDQTLNLVMPTAKLTVSVLDAQGNRITGGQLTYTSNSGINPLPGIPGSSALAIPEGGTTLDANGNATLLVPKGVTLTGPEIKLTNGLVIPFTAPVMNGDKSVTVTIPPAVHVQGSFGDSEGDAFNNSGDQITFSSPLNPGSTVHPDANGNYSVELLADQNVKVSTNIGLNGQVLEFNNLPVGALQSDQTLNLVMPTAKLTVSVLDAQGNPITGGQLTYTSNSGINPLPGIPGSSALAIPEGGTTLDANGNATLLVPKGVTLTGPEIKLTNGLVIPFTAPVMNGDKSVTVTIPPAVHVQGSFGDSEGDAFNNSGDQITFSSPLNPGSTVHPDANGNYSVELLADQNVKVSTNIGLNGQVLEFNNLPVGALQSDQTLNLVMPTAKLTVSVLDAQGNPITGGQLTYTSNSGINPLPGIPGSSALAIPEGGTTLDANGNATLLVPKGVTLTGPEIKLTNGLVIPFTLPALTGDLHAILIFNATTGSIGVDDQAPVVTGTSDRAANANGWYNKPVTVTWSVFEPLPAFGPPTIPSLTTVSTEGASQIITSGQSCDIEGLCSTGSVKVSIDETPPSVSNVSLDHSTITAGDTTTLSADVSDSLSGVAAAEYFVDTDPGQGNGTAMSIGSASATATIGAGLTPGVHTVSVRAQDEAGNWSAPASTQISVRPQAPTGLSAPTPTQTPVLSWNAVAGATSYNIYRDGTKIDSASSPSYTDSSAAVGPHTYQVTAVTGGLESDPSNSANVLVGTPPVITSLSSASTGMRVPFDFTITTSGAPTAALSEAGSLPNGLTFADNGDGTADISGIAVAGTAGTYPLTISADNGIGDAVTQSFVLTVTTATSPPVITSPPTDTETVGVPFSFTVTTNGYPVPKFAKTGSLPSGVAFTDNGDGTATIAGTASASAVASYHLTITAKNSAGTTTQAFTLIITKAPVLKNVTNQTAKTGTAYSKTITAVGTPTPAITETGPLPAGITFTDNGDGTATLAGTPAGNAGGSYQITVTASNSLGSSSESFTLKVDQPPAITSPASASATVGTSFSYQITTTGYPAPRLSKLGTLPKGLTFKASAGTITGTPAAGSAGTYEIAIGAKNSTGSTILILTIVVN